MLKKLTDAFGPSGCEDEVRDIIINEITPFCDSVKVDRMGNVIAFKKGRDSSKKFMADAHMDEVGLIIKGITEEGYLKFVEIGGLDDRILPGKRVICGENRVPGVIGLKALHLTTGEERKSVAKQKDMYIDIGAVSREEASFLVQVGDYVCFDSQYIQFGDGMIKAKALDDRVGVAILIEMLKTAQPAYDFYASFSVQEEIGLRGAAVTSKEIMPDYALAIEGTICADGDGVPEHLQVTKSGGGVSFSVMERSSLADSDMLSFAKKTALEENLPFQLKRTGNGGNNAGTIQLAGCGVKTLAMAVPCRYLHSPGCVINRKDYLAAEKLAIKICERIDTLCLKD